MKKSAGKKKHSRRPVTQIMILRENDEKWSPIAMIGVAADGNRGPPEPRNAKRTLLGAKGGGGGVARRFHGPPGACDPYILLGVIFDPNQLT